jgi:hypothetical protein
MENNDAILAKASELLVLVGARPLKSGRLTLHFDGEGLVQDVEVNFKRKVRRASVTLPAGRAPLRVAG